jgi:hypothetical protein
MDSAIGARATAIRDPIAVAAFALIQGIFIHWKAFADPNRFHENWRQSPHWLSPEHQSFQPDDLMIRYAEFNTSPFADLLYKTLARTGHDILWGKVNTVVFFAITAALVFITARAMAGRFAGFAATAIFLFFPCALKVFAGGFMSGLSMPLLCLAVLVVHRQAWWWSIPLIVASVQVYPMVAIQSGVLYIVDVCVHDRGRVREREFLVHKLLPLSIAAVLCAGFMLAKYPAGGHDYGHIVDRVEIADRAEFADGVLDSSEQGLLDLGSVGVQPAESEERRRHQQAAEDGGRDQVEGDDASDPPVDEAGEGDVPEPVQTPEEPSPRRVVGAVARSRPDIRLVPRGVPGASKVETDQLHHETVPTRYPPRQGGERALVGHRRSGIHRVAPRGLAPRSWRPRGRPRRPLHRSRGPRR